MTTDVARPALTGNFWDSAIAMSAVVPSGRVKRVSWAPDEQLIQVITARKAEETMQDMSHSDRLSSLCKRWSRLVCPELSASFHCCRRNMCMNGPILFDFQVFAATCCILKVIDLLRRTNSLLESLPSKNASIVGLHTRWSGKYSHAMRAVGY
jgi:hypothetical protein